MSLIYQLTKQTVNLERLPKLDGVLSSFRTDQFSFGTPSQVYGVRLRSNFPNDLIKFKKELDHICLLYTSPSPRD